MADDVAKQSVSNEAESDTQSTENTPSDQTQDPTDKPNDRPIKTGNPDLDDVFKDAYPTDDGKKGYHLPNKTQAELVEELSKIDGAVQKGTLNGGKNTILPDGTKIDTYPARESSNYTKPGWSITKPNASRPTYKGDTKQ